MKGVERTQMDSSRQRANYDLIAHLYDEPGRDYGIDPDLVEFLSETAEQRSSRCRVLDLGCGTGKQLAASHHGLAGIQATGLDLFYGMLVQARKRGAGIHWVQGDSANPPFASGSFDYITNQFSYHHIQDKKRMLSEIFRILKPGGRFVITNLDPWSMLGWIVYTYFPTSRQRDLVDFLPMHELTSLMQKAGFSNVRTTYRHTRGEENLSEFLAYASQRHRTSQLMAIPDNDYADGISRLKESVRKLSVESRISSEICLVCVRGDKPANSFA